MLKILVLAYQISPTRGSEFSVAWNYVINMSKDNELVVSYGVSGDHMGDTNELEQYIKDSPIPNVRFVAIKPNKIANSLNSLNRKGVFVYSFYLAYNVWHRQVFIKAKELLLKDQFDLIHYLNPIGFREPGYLWKLKIPYLWGPISGAVNRPVNLFVGLSFKYKIYFQLRNVVNFLQFRYNLRLKKALNETDLLLTATSENQKLFIKYYNKESIWLPENAIINSQIHRFLCMKKEDIVNIVWIGRIDANKSLHVLLDALKGITSEKWYLNIIGDGPLKSSMQKKANRLGYEFRISWFGHVPREKVLEILEKSHLHIITSLGEGNPTTLWETMSYGIPTISLDHCGMHDIICEKCGIKIKIETYQQVVRDFSDTLTFIFKDPAVLNEYSKGVNNCAENYLWSKRINFLNNLYSLTIENWKRKMIKHGNS